MLTGDVLTKISRQMGEIRQKIFIFKSYKILMCALKSGKASFFKKVNLCSDKPLARETLRVLSDDAHSMLLPVQSNCSLCPQRSALVGA